MKFNGKTYKETTAASTKADAIAIVKSLRKQGKDARYVKRAHSYTIYSKKKR